jgi:hypothetical protein
VTIGKTNFHAGIKEMVGKMLSPIVDRDMLSNIIQDKILILLTPQK